MPRPTTEDPAALAAPPRASPAVLAVALLLLLALLGSAADPAIYHGDERFYTDAALEMARSGDWSVPRYPDGSPRLNKPLLCYWTILAGHEVFGAGLLGARLPFVLATVALVVLAGATATRLARDRRLGLLAALVLASHPDVQLLGWRSTPDPLVALFVLVALDGAARVLLEGERGPRGAWQLWLGVGLTVGAKGLWGLVVAAFVVGGCLVRPALRARLRALAAPAPVAAGALVAAVSVLPLLLAGAAAAVESGAADQVRPTASVTAVVGNLLEYGLSPLTRLLPWVVALLVGLSSRTGRRLAAKALARPASRAALAWFLTLVAVFSLGTIRRVRYLAPSAAGLAFVTAALMLALAADADTRARLRGACSALATALGVALLVVAGLVASVRPWLAATLASVGAAAVLLGVLVPRKAPQLAPTVLGWVLLLASCAFTGLLKPAFAYSPLPELVAWLEQHGAARDDVVVAGLEGEVASKLRLLSAGRLEPLELAQPSDLGHSPLPFAVGAARDISLWRSLGYQEVARFDAPGSPRGADVLRWLRGATPEPRRHAPEREISLLARAVR